MSSSYVGGIRYCAAHRPTLLHCNKSDQVFRMPEGAKIRQRVFSRALLKLNI